MFGFPKPSNPTCTAIISDKNGDFVGGRVPLHTAKKKRWFDKNKPSMMRRIPNSPLHEMPEGQMARPSALLAFLGWGEESPHQKISFHDEGDSGVTVTGTSDGVGAVGLNHGGIAVDHGGVDSCWVLVRRNLPPMVAESRVAAGVSLV